ncbi:hypothetical protein [Kocuria marina]|uniref:hypothetical protein n=1 Tax=Kocuria marina TaxID=223184 RepID=UPI0021B21B8F|nr:hypothetical protein [Kocuria indica]
MIISQAWLDVELPRRKPSQAAVLGAADAVLHPCMGPVPGLEKGELAGRGVGVEGFVAPAVAFLEQRQLRAGVGAFAAHDHPHPGWPLGENLRVDEAGQLGDVAALTNAAVGIECWGPDLLRDQIDGIAELSGDRESHAVLDAAAADRAPSGEGRGSRRSVRPQVTAGESAGGTRRGPRKTTAGHDEAQVRNLLSPGLFCRDDRI